LHELRKDVRALVVDEVHLLDTKLADFLFPEILTLPAGPPAGATARSARSTTRASLAPWATVAAFAPRRPAGRCCLFLFFCHTFHPFILRPWPERSSCACEPDSFGVTMS
jgi:hypothetical protein